MKLNDETVEEVDMLLMYLYTLEEPNFLNKEVLQYDCIAAESALKLGDKYNLPALGTAGQLHLNDFFEHSFRVWPQLGDDCKEMGFECLTHLWELRYIGTENLRETAIKSLVHIAKDVVEHKSFETLCMANPEFAIAFSRALAKK